MSTSVKTRKMTSNKGTDNRKSTAQRVSPKLTKYLQSTIPSTITAKTPTIDTVQRESAMPTPTRGSQNKDKQQNEVRDIVYRDESESESEVNSVASDLLLDEEEENFFKMEYNNIRELEAECLDDIDPREVELTRDAIPIIFLALIKKIDKVQTRDVDIQHENNSLRQMIENNEKEMKTQGLELKRLEIERLKMKETQTEIERDNNNLKTSLDFAHNQIAILETKEKERTETERKVQKNIEVIKNENIKLKEDNKKNKDKNVKAEAYSRRSNLRFEGIPHSPNETNVESRNKVYEFLKTNLGMKDAERDIIIERCHRDPKYPNQNPPSIIARFLDFNDRQEIWGHRNKVNQNRQNRLYINEDFPQEVEKKRSFLRPYVKAAYKNNLRATLIGDTLLVEGEKYNVDNLHTLPEKIRPEKTVVRTDGKSTVFFRKDAFLSNFHPSPFRIDGEDYTCVEQFYMAAKADKFDDKEAKGKIMSSTDPHEINFKGRSIKNFKQSTWKESAYEVMKKGVKAKFEQNNQLRTLLNNTGDTIIGEGSANDLVWGTGIPVFHNDALDRNKWKGENLLGKILMEIRDNKN